MKRTIPTNLHAGTAGVLIEWLEKLVNAIHPDNAIEWWNPGRHERIGLEASTGIQAREALPTSIHHLGAYVRLGNCEGYVLEVVVAPYEPHAKPEALRCLCTAKLFGRREEAWKIAMLVSEALEDVLLYHGQSVIPDLYDKLPKGPHSFMRETTLRGEVRVEAVEQPDKTWVVTATDTQGTRIDERTEPHFHAAEALVQDWQTVLDGQVRMGVQITPHITMCHREIEHAAA